MPEATVKYLVVDVESVADGDLVASVHFAGQNCDPREAVQRFRQELLAERNRDFIPYTFQIPVAVVIAKVSADFQLLDLVALDEPEFRSHIMTRHFWVGWEKYHHPTLVTFNGRTFDLPLLELAAFRYGISIGAWFAPGMKWDQPRSRYNVEAHLDLHDLLVNFGATRFTGGLNLAAHLLGKPGKLDVQGYMVQDLHDAGQLMTINNYCRCDVLDTYFVFLRTMVVLGRLTLDQERERIQSAKAWLIQRQETVPVYRDYLAAWGDWRSPW
jgi:predicted PolB exonuclease-like 3'-5' exonuclease